MSAPLPRVTAILEAVGLGPDLSHVPPDVLAAAQARGTRVHELVEAECYGYLDDADVTPEVAPYLDGWKKFLAESGFRPLVAEVEVVHPTWRYRGHPDVIGWLGTDRVLIDVKTGDSTAASYQVAAYVLAWNAQHPDQPVTAGAVLHLRENGTYRYEEVELPHAEPVWLAAVTVYHAQSRRVAA